MPTPAETARRELLSRLARMPMFAGLDGASLSDLADAMQWLALPGGATLFDQGEDSDALYVLLHGRLAAVHIGGDGQSRALGAIAPGECAGEIGLITGQPRFSASARRSRFASGAPVALRSPSGRVTGVCERALA